MQKSEKQTKTLLFDIVYQQSQQFKPSILVYSCFIALQFCLCLIKYYDIIDPSWLKSLQIPYQSLFIVQIALILLFLLLTIVSYKFNILTWIWAYFLLLMDSIGIIYSHTVMSCFGSAGWCEFDIKYQISSVLLLVFFFLIVVLPRSYFYYPFHDCFHSLSMKSGQKIIIFFIYTVILCAISGQIILTDKSLQKQFLLIATVCLFTYNIDQASTNPHVSRIYSVLEKFMLWTTFLIYTTPILKSLSDAQMPDIEAFWYYWGYSSPIILGVSFVSKEIINYANGWEVLFDHDKMGKAQLSELYLLTNQLINKVDIIKRSQLRTNSKEFKKLWDLCIHHCNSCIDSECPLQIVKQLKIEQMDQFVQTKRFTKTVQSVFDYGMHMLENRKQINPNLLSLNIEIVNYQLEVFHLRQKGLVLFNSHYYKEETTNEQKYNLYYLKKKIQSFYTNNDNYAKANSQEEITAFKHSIEVSVTMLAEFWYFLSDPKCNLKKLYDLANILFPMKIGVDNQWNNIKKLKNTECYNLYAKYLIKMFNDKEKGIKILQEVRRIEQQAKEKLQVDLNEGASQQSEENGIIFLEFDGKNSGIMYQINTSCQKIFGYNKGELLNRKVNDIMPKIFAFHHDRILENYQQTNKPKMMNKERAIWGRSKDGYLFPFTICIKPIRNFFSQTSEVYASVKRQLWVKQFAFLMVDLDYNITDISASLLGIFPDLHGRINMKKKVPVSEIISEFIEIKGKIINKGEAHELQITREFKISTTNSYKESTIFNLTIDQIAITISGTIGYLVKLNKGFSSQSQSNVSNLLEAPNQNTNSCLSNAVSNNNWTNKGNNFRIFMTIEEKDQENIRKIRYHGGLVAEENITKNLIYSRIQKSLQNSKISAQKMQQSSQKIDYTGEIKTKRLQNNGIREIHEVSEQSQLNMNVDENESQNEENSDQIKPSELNSILERQINNNHISMLKVLTIVILAISSAVCVVQYIFLYTHNTNITQNIASLNLINRLEAQVMYINNYCLSLSVNYDNAIIQLMAPEIDQLDQLADGLPQVIDSTVVYSDMTTQSMLLSFAINKMVSESQTLSATQGPYAANNNDLFFINYNSVNSIYISCEETIAYFNKLFNAEMSDQSRQCVIFIAASSAFFFILLVIKNLLIRSVLKKKAEILNIFFQIPRGACSAIQKQCQKFIQRLTSDDNDDLQIQSVMSGDEDKQGLTKRGKQKKRTIMGQQKTANNFIFTSLAFLCFLIFYPLIALIIFSQNEPYIKYTFGVTDNVLKWQKETAKAISFVNSVIIHPQYPLGNIDSFTSINQEYTKLQQLMSSIQEQFYYIGNIFDDRYLSAYNSLLYNNLCQPKGNCSYTYGEDKGLNYLIFQYQDYIITKYLNIQRMKSNGTIINSSLLTQSVLQQEEILKVLMKKYWRQMTDIVSQGMSRLINAQDSLLFGLMLTISILNFTVFLYGWIKFYNNLQQKIIATQYILTFIPIDEINKNSKIVKYIKEEILDKK